MKYSYFLILLSINLALPLALHGVNNKEKYTVAIELPRISYNYSADDSSEPEHSSTLSAKKQSAEPSPQKTITNPKKCSWFSGKDLLITGLVSYLALSIAPDVASIWGSNTMNSISSPITMHPYTMENGTLVPPALEEKPDCFYYSYKPHAYLSYCAQGECLCTDDGECYCIVEDCDSTGNYAKSCNAIRLGLIAGLSVKVTTIFSYALYQGAQCGHFLCKKVTKANK